MARAVGGFEDPIQPALDGQEHSLHANGQEWLVSWHPPSSAPAGKNHGASGLCLAPDGGLVLVTEDGSAWGLPGGRPEAGESQRQTLEREVLEEACCQVQEATLLGYWKSHCLQGHEQGLTIVRSVWRASVRVLPWEPEFEMQGRIFVPPDRAMEHMDFGNGHPMLYRRAFVEAFGA